MRTEPFKSEAITKAFREVDRYNYRANRKIRKWIREMQKNRQRHIKATPLMMHHIGLIAYGKGPDCDRPMEWAPYVNKVNRTIDFVPVKKL